MESQEITNGENAECENTEIYIPSGTPDDGLEREEGKRRKESKREKKKRSARQQEERKRESRYKKYPHKRVLFLRGWIIEWSTAVMRGEVPDRPDSDGLDGTVQMGGTDSKKKKKKSVD